MGPKNFPYYSETALFESALFENLLYCTFTQNQYFINIESYYSGSLKNLDMLPWIFYTLTLKTKVNMRARPKMISVKISLNANWFAKNCQPSNWKIKCPKAWKSLNIWCKWKLQWKNMHRYFYHLLLLLLHFAILHRHTNIGYLFYFTFYASGSGKRL